VTDPFEQALAAAEREARETHDWKQQCADDLEAGRETASAMRMRANARERLDAALHAINVARKALDAKPVPRRVHASDHGEAA
jgi:hypothetical protein